MRPGLPRIPTRHQVVLVEPIALNAEDFAAIDLDPAPPGLCLAVPNAEEELDRDRIGVEPRGGAPLFSCGAETAETPSTPSTVRPTATKRGIA